MFSVCDFRRIVSLFQISRSFASHFCGSLCDNTCKRVPWSNLNAFLWVCACTDVVWAHWVFWLFAVMAALSLFTSSTLPLAESLTLAHLATTNGHYSRIRMWGWLGFIFAHVKLAFLFYFLGSFPHFFFLFNISYIFFLNILFHKTSTY